MSIEHGIYLAFNRSFSRDLPMNKLTRENVKFVQDNFFDHSRIQLRSLAEQAL